MKTTIAILYCIGWIILASCRVNPPVTVLANSSEDGYLFLTNKVMYIKDYLNNPDTSITNGKDSIPVRMNYTENKINVSVIDIGTPIPYETPFRIVNDSQIAFDKAILVDSTGLRSADYVLFIDRKTAKYIYDGNQMVIIFDARKFERTHNYNNNGTLDYIISHNWDTLRVPRRNDQ